MKASKFTDARKALIIKQGEDGPLDAEICRRVGIHWPIGERAAIADRQSGDVFY